MNALGAIRFHSDIILPFLCIGDDYSIQFVGQGNTLKRPKGIALIRLNRLDQLPRTQKRCRKRIACLRSSVFEVLRRNLWEQKGLQFTVNLALVGRCPACNPGARGDSCLRVPLRKNAHPVKR
jgi:hypothetical protein